MPLIGDSFMNASISATPPLLRYRLARHVRHRRLQRGWSQEDLAEAAGLHRTYIGSIERAERNVGIGTLERLAQALDVEPGVLLGQGV